MQGLYQVTTEDPFWRPIQQFTTASLPPLFRYWLLDDGSLTKRLINLGQGPFRVERLRQGWQVPLPSERALLGIPPRQLALIREVALMIADRPVVFARSVFPHASLTGSLTHLRKLQNKPLGAILFNHPGMHRSPFELTRLEPGSRYLPTALRQPETAWARRSRFTIDNKALMVSEVFLRGFTPWPRSLPVHRTQRGTVSSGMLYPKHSTPKP